MIKIEEVFIDYDGVMVDFPQGVMDLFNVSPEVMTADDLTDWNFSKQIGITEKDMWAAIDRLGERFWSDLVHPYSWAINIMVELHNEFGVDPVIATSPSQSPSSAGGKADSISKLLGGGFRNWAITPRKELFAREGRVLIDDREKNIEKFEAHGGIGILFPRPWNKAGEFLPLDQFQIVQYVINLIKIRAGGKSDV